MFPNIVVYNYKNFKIINLILYSNIIFDKLQTNVVPLNLFFIYINHYCINVNHHLAQITGNNEIKSKTYL